MSQICLFQTIAATTKHFPQEIPLSSTWTKVIISRSGPLPRALRALVGPTDTEGVRFPFSGPLG